VHAAITVSRVVILAGVEVIVRTPDVVHGIVECERIAAQQSRAGLHVTGQARERIPVEHGIVGRKARAMHLPFERRERLEVGQVA
jgi:hypothetical protein